MDNIVTYTETAIELTVLYAPKLALALIVLLIGLWIIKGASKLTVKSLKKTNVDQTLVPFIRSLVSWGLKALLFISVASMVGIATTSFIAVLGAASLAVGLALQGSLANFAGGVLILLFKPYTLGDLIEAQGHLGVVKEVQIFNTILLSLDNKQIIIPNGAMSNGSVLNYSTEENRRVDLVIGIAYESDIPKAKDILMNVLKEEELVLSDPAPMVAVSELADSSVNLVVRPWCKSADYWDVHFSITEKAKVALETNGISIPFPQRDIHMYEVKDS